MEWALRSDGGPSAGNRRRHGAATADARPAIRPELTTAASRLCVTAAVVATLLLLGLAQPTPIDAADKCRLVAPAKAQTGTPYSLRGTGFAANTAIAVSLKGGGKKVDVSVQSDKKGGFSLLLGAAYGEQGRYTVSAQGGKGKTRCLAKATYTVAIGPVPSPTPSLPPLPDPAPTAGISLPTLAIAGVVAALAWAVFVVAALARLRRRRSTE